MRTLLATSLFAVAVSASEFLSSPKRKFDELSQGIDNIADLWFYHWWESDSENNLTVFEQWELKLKGDATWKVGSQAEWYVCEL